MITCAHTMRKNTISCLRTIKKNKKTYQTQLISKTQNTGTIAVTRELALMIQLEQQQHRKFWVGRVGGVGDN